MTYRHTEASKELIRQWNLGRQASDETKAKMSAAKLGKKRAPFTAEHRAKMSASRTKKTVAL
jgi:hypothetical protein